MRAKFIFYSVAGTAEKRREEESEGEFLPDSQGQNKNQFPHTGLNIF
jgi:hypothetical protein